MRQATLAKQHVRGPKSQRARTSTKPAGRTINDLQPVGSTSVVSKRTPSERLTLIGSAAPPGNEVPPPQKWFDQVWIVSLKRRGDRLDRFWKEFAKASWPFRKPEIFWAIDGDKVGVPKYWQTGGGSYGCLRSHATILERAIQDDVDSILVLEDDATFDTTFETSVMAFLSNVPPDWQCLMLGGQHVNSEPILIGSGIVRAGGGGGIQRTHCYALRGREAMKALYSTWANAAVHCDWVMGPCMNRFNTYAPHPFLVGQAEGHSDISARKNPTKFWRSPAGTEPVIILRAPRAVMEALREKYWHSGYTRDQSTGFDVGLRDIFAADPSTVDLASRLREWIAMIQGEVVSMTDQAYCTIWHPAVTGELVRRLVKGKVVEITAVSVAEALSKLPPDISAVPIEPIVAVLLHASLQTMDELRKLGWHNGHWRDVVTGQDNGIRRLFAATREKANRAAGLRELIKLLSEEVKEIPNGVVVVWHDEITRDMVESDNVSCVEITAENPESAIAQFKEVKNGNPTH